MLWKCKQRWDATHFMLECPLYNRLLSRLQDKSIKQSQVFLSIGQSSRYQSSIFTEATTLRYPKELAFPIPLLIPYKPFDFPDLKNQVHFIRSCEPNPCVISRQQTNNKSRYCSTRSCKAKFRGNREQDLRLKSLQSSSLEKSPQKSGAECDSPVLPAHGQLLTLWQTPPGNVSGYNILLVNW